MYPSLTAAHHELTKSILYLRTSFHATRNLEILIESSHPLNKYYSTNWNVKEWAKCESELQQQQRDLEVWKERFIEASMGIVEWAAVKALGRGLPEEILGMVRGELGRGEGELPELRGSLIRDCDR